MDSIKYYIVDGKLLPAEEFQISVKNRSFNYGDGVFESIRVFNGTTWSLAPHISRLIEGLKAIGITVPSEFSESYFETQIKELLNSNGFDKGARLKLIAFRKEGGFYQPTNNNVSWMIYAEETDWNIFKLNGEGLKADIYQKHRFDKSPFSMYKTNNQLEHILAGIYCKENNLDDCFLQNKNGHIVEACSSNVFIVSNRVLYTPPLDDGCLAGTMRMNVINMALEKNLKVYECSLNPQNLLVADEIFLTNAIRGIQWVGSYRSKRYFNDLSKTLLDHMNERALSLTKGH